MGPSSIISKSNTHRNGAGRIVQVKLAGCRLASNCIVLYDQETIRNNGQPSYQRLKASVRRHIDQTITTRNFRVWNEIVERGEQLPRVDRGKEAYVERKVGECSLVKANGQCSERDSCSFGHEPVSRSRYEAQVRTGQSSSPAPDTKAKTDNSWPIFEK